MTNNGSRKAYLRRGRPPVHSGFSLVKPVAVRKYLTLIRSELVMDLGGEGNISTQEKLIVDAIINLLSITRSVEEFIRGSSVMTGSDIAPVLRTSYLGYRNSISRHLVLLGLEARNGQQDPMKYLEDL